MIKHIVIVGGGTAGWATMCLAIDRISADHNIKLTIIEPKDLPIIGVGESTTGQFPLLIKTAKHLGDEAEFLRETGSTYKYGIRHSDWRVVGEHFDNPNGFATDNLTRYPTQDYDHLRIYHVAQNNMPHTAFLSNRAMAENKIYYMDYVPIANPYPGFLGKGGGPRFFDLNDHGYHLATWETVEYLRKKCLATGRINIINDKVVDVIRDENDMVTKLKLEHSEVEADFFIDCTGFKRTLIKHNNKFISYKNSLLLDSAIAFPQVYQRGEKIRCYTHAKAMKNGWMWESPTQERMGRGYNYSSDLNTEDEIMQELEEHFGYEVPVLARIKYDSGRMDKFWRKNVLSTGLASGFLEPLEAASLHSTMKQIEHFFEAYFHGHLNMSGEVIQDKYNETIADFWDDIRDFMLWHYQNSRQDSEFWRHSSHADRLSDKLRGNMELWKIRLPRNDDYHNGKKGSLLTLGNILWYQTAIGMKLLDPKLAQQELDYFGLNDVVKHDMKHYTELSDYMLPKLMDTDEFYKTVLNYPG